MRSQLAVYPAAPVDFGAARRACNRLLLAVSAAALLAAGCGGAGSEPVWEGPPRPLASDGALPVDAFNAYVDAVAPTWRSSLTGVATAYALPLVGDANTIETVLVPHSRDDSRNVTVTVGNLADDSVADLRLGLALEPADGGWTIAEAGWTQRCRVGRGHRDWSTELCI